MIWGFIHHEDHEEREAQTTAPMSTDLSFPIYEGMANPEEYGRSPDIGRYQIKDGYVYTEYGRMFEYKPLEVIFRMLPVSIEDTLTMNFSDWSEEKRTRTLAIYEEIWAKEIEIEAEREAKLRAIAETAESKLTEAEQAALCWFYRQ